MLIETEIPIKIGGFASGNYVCLCRRCDRDFIGDKRAIKCLPCAISEIEQVLQSAGMVIRLLLAHPNSQPAKDRASKFLVNYGLQGSILRSDDQPAPHATGAPEASEQ